jgi:hypothetical protein
LSATVIDLQLLLNPYRGGDGVRCAVESGQNAVPGVLDDAAPVAQHPDPHQLVVAFPEAFGLLLAQPDAKGGRVHQVGEHHAQRLYPALGGLGRSHRDQLWGGSLDFGNQAQLPGVSHAFKSGEVLLAHSSVCDKQGSALAPTIQRGDWLRPFRLRRAWSNAT